MTNKRLNILFTASWYPSKVHPTLGNFIQRHAEAVAVLHNVHVLYITSPADYSGTSYLEHVTISGVETTIIYCKKGMLNKFNAFRSAVNELLEKPQLQFDLVHHHVLWPHGWQARWLNKKYGIPYIVTEHWTGFDPARRKQSHLLIKPLAKYAAAKAFAICPVSLDLASTMSGYGIKGNYRVVPNVVDTSLFRISHATEERIRFLHVSSLVDAHKNISGILRVWKKISDAYPKAHLTIGGDGPFQMWEKESQQLGIAPSRIAWFGEVPWEDVAAKMQSSHALILFSNYENLPCVIVEAMACGLGIISSRVGGISEHITTERGILVEPANESQLYSAISSVCENPHQFNRAEQRNYAVNHFSQQAIAQQFDRIYREAIAQ